MPKKKTKAKRKGNVFNETNVKAIVALLVLFLAFAVLALFYVYQQSIVTYNFQLFMLLTVVFFGLLIGLLFLMNPRK
jgi:flagellar biosynthesis protein FlhB